MIKRIALASIFTVFSLATLGNAPYPLLGYGLLYFAIYSIVYIFKAKEAILSLVVGTIIGSLLLFYTQSVFTLVAIALIFIVLLQAILLIYFTKRNVILSSTLLSTLIVSVVIVLLGVGYYGEGGISTAFSFLNILYAIPAYLLLKLKEKGYGDLSYMLMISSTIALFISLSTFLLYIVLIVSIASFIVAYYLLIRKSKISRNILALIILILVLGYSLGIYLNKPASDFAIRASFYSFYPDSLSGTQWIQKNQSNLCLQGNLAGGRTVETGVYDPQRLRVINTCVTVIGTIVGITNQSGNATDRDFLIDIILDPQYTYLLSLGSYIFFKPVTMHVEVIPVMQSIVLKGLNLKPGDRIMVTGVFVLDTDHGWWSEIHPAWKIEKIE
jgi:hypothetical protein